MSGFRCLRVSLCLKPTLDAFADACMVCCGVPLKDKADPRPRGDVVDGEVRRFGSQASK